MKLKMIRKRLPLCPECNHHLMHSFYNDSEWICSECGSQFIEVKETDDTDMKDRCDVTGSHDNPNISYKNTWKGEKKEE